MSASTTLSQISCFSSINHDRKLHLRYPSIVVAKFPSKFSVRVHLDGSSTGTPSETTTTLKFETDGAKSHVEGPGKSYSTNEEAVSELEPVPEQVVSPPKKSAKIHDFCLGIPFGGLVLGGGLTGFLLSGNLTTLSTGILYGGGLLALSTFSLKVWKQGKSSLPFILGQSALSSALLWKHFQNYSLTKKTIPIRVLRCYKRCNVMFLFLCAALWREPTTKEVEGSCWFTIVIQTLRLPHVFSVKDLLELDQNLGRSAELLLPCQSK